MSNIQINQSQSNVMMAKQIMLPHNFNSSNPILLSQLCNIHNVNIIPIYDINKTYNVQPFINSKKDILISSLLKFYKNKDNMNILKKITYQQSAISLRILDYFVTNYSKKYNINYELTTKKNDRTNFIVYLEYKSQLKAYSKKQFDPFCRNKRISLRDLDGIENETTIGQLNFFKWAIENKIIEYVEKNFDVIDNDMTNTNNIKIDKKSNSKKNNITNSKKKDFTVSATKLVNKISMDIVLKFD